MKFYEFFAGGGTARLGLGEAWTCEFSNDCCLKKAESNRANFRQSNLLVKSIHDITIGELPTEKVVRFVVPDQGKHKNLPIV